jgi:hypothetical protein
MPSKESNAVIEDRFTLLEFHSTAWGSIVKLFVLTNPLTVTYMYSSLMDRSFNDSYPLKRYLGSNMIMNREKSSTSWHCIGISASTANSPDFDQKVDDLLLT